MTPGFIYIPCEQGSAEWHEHRAGTVTASMFQTIMDVPTRGKERYSSDARKYAMNKAIERISKKPLSDEMGEGFKTWQMRRGNEKEPLARIELMHRKGYVIEEAGICLSMDRKFGASSDGFIGQDGSCEIKCLVASDRLMRVWVDDDIDEFFAQIQGCLWLSGRQWCDFCLYAPQLANIGKTLYTKRVMRDDNYIETLELQLIEFDQYIEEFVAALTAAGESPK